jgi:type IX secretion system PorP/SprF family membrane protein
MKLSPAFLLIAMMTSVWTYGQQLPDYTLYTNNLTLLNPAYTGVPDDLAFTMGYRKQWAGFDGAPAVFSFVGHGFLPRYRVGLGLNGWQYTTGALSQTALFTDYAYRLPFEKFTLQFGLSAGILNYRTNYAGADLNGINDPLFTNDINETNFNTGAGVFLYSEKYYAGLSAPVLITYGNKESTLVKMNRHFAAFGGYVFDVNEKVDVKPHVLLKLVEHSPLMVVAGVTGYYHQIIGLGLLYKSQQKTMAVTLDANFEKVLYLGYAYDLSGGTDISAAQYGSHEIVATYFFTRKTADAERKMRYY